MSPKFGTSGLRGLVVDLTDDLVAAHVQAFIRACPVGTGLFVGRDLRPSSPDIAAMVAHAAQAAGLAVTDCGNFASLGWQDAACCGPCDHARHDRRCAVYGAVS